MLIKSQEIKCIYAKVLHNFVKQRYNNNEHTINKSYQDKNKPGFWMRYKTSKVTGVFLHFLKTFFRHTKRPFKDEWLPTYVIMLRKRWTSGECMGKKQIKKILPFFFLKLMNTNVWIPKNFHYNENLTIFKFWWIFLFVKGGGGGFVIKLVAANFLKVIRQYSFSYNYLSIKKEIW